MEDEATTAEAPLRDTHTRLGNAEEPGSLSSAAVLCCAVVVVWWCVRCDGCCCADEAACGHWANCARLCLAPSAAPAPSSQLLQLSQPLPHPPSAPPLSSPCLSILRSWRVSDSVSE